MIEGIISSISEAVAKTGSPYCVLTLLHHKEPQRTINIWGCKAAQFGYGKVVHIQNPKISDQGASANFSQVSLQEAPEEFRVLLPQPPTQYEWDIVVSKVCDLIPPTYETIFRTAAEHFFAPFSKATAAKSNHHNFPGGLLRHTYELLNIFVHMYPALPWKVNPFVVATACLFHDAYKLYEYSPSDFSYTKYMFLVGHPTGSAEMCEAFLNSHNVNPEIILHCKHAVLAHHLNPGNLNWGSPVSPATIEAFITAMCDMISGHGTSIAQTPDMTKCFAMGTNIVKCPEL